MESRGTQTLHNIAWNYTDRIGNATGIQQTRNPGILDSAHPGIREFEHLGIWEPDNPRIWGAVYPGIWGSGSAGSRNPGIQESWSPGIPESKHPGIRASRNRRIQELIWELCRLAPDLRYLHGIATNCMLRGIVRNYFIISLEIYRKWYPT